MASGRAAATVSTGGGVVVAVFRGQKSGQVLGPYKRFSVELHEENDGPAKDAVSRFIFGQWGLDVDEGSTYGVDLLCYRDYVLVGYVEVERRHNWVLDFPFETVHVPERKAKFLSLDRPMVLFSVRSDLAQAMWCHGHEISSSPIEAKDNRYLKGERFYCVPVEKWTLVWL